MYEIPVMIRRIKLPRNGILNQKIMKSAITIISISATTPNGRALPIINSTGRIGDTVSCSIVPLSRSFTIDIDVSIIITRPVMSARIAGKKNILLSIFGLKKTVGSIVTGVDVTRIPVREIFFL